MLVIRNRDNRLLKHERTVKVDTPADWYRFHIFFSDEKETLQHFFKGLLHIFDNEKIKYKLFGPPRSARECLQYFMQDNPRGLRILAKRYKLKFIVYKTKNTEQLVAIKFDDKKSEVLFRIKYAEHLFFR